MTFHASNTTTCLFNCCHRELFEFTGIKENNKRNWYKPSSQTTVLDFKALSVQNQKPSAQIPCVNAELSKTLV